MNHRSTVLFAGILLIIQMGGWYVLSVEKMKKLKNK